jgi:hypothetical protein
MWPKPYEEAGANVSHWRPTRETDGKRFNIVRDEASPTAAVL